MGASKTKMQCIEQQKQLVGDKQTGVTLQSFPHTQELSKRPANNPTGPKDIKTI